MVEDKIYTMLKRFITILILAPLLIISIYKLTNFYFSLLAGIIILIASWEWSAFIHFKKLFSRILFVLFTLLLLIISHIYLTNIYSFLYIVVFWWLINIVCIIYYPKVQYFWNGNYFIRVINGFLVLIPTWISIIIIRQKLGEGFLLFLFFLIWGADTGAYIVGKFVGKTKLAKNISPKKTWEGVMGAFVTAIIVSLLVLYFNNFDTKVWWQYLLLTLLVTVFSIVGDLFESLYKRNANIDNSGFFLPGHGGIMDRIDSLTSSAPIFFIGCNFLYF